MDSLPVESVKRRMVAKRYPSVLDTGDEIMICSDYLYFKAQEEMLLWINKYFEQAGHRVAFYPGHQQQESDE